MNKKTALSQVNQQGKQNLSANDTHFANINAAKNVWWFDIPIHKLSDNIYINVLLYDCSDRKLYHLKVPYNYFQDHHFDFSICKDKQVIRLELSADISNRFQDVRAGGSQVNFQYFLKGEYDDALVNAQHPEPIQIKSVLRQQNTLETAEKQKNQSKLTETQAINEPLPNAPDGRDDISSQIAQMCETNYGEPIRLIYWRMKSDGEQFSILFRERRRGWYFQELVTKENEQWSSESRVLPSFLLLLEPDGKVWVELTKKATTEDWCALDEIFLNTLAFPGSEVILAGSDLIGEEVTDEAIEQFGFYVPDENLLPTLVFKNPPLEMQLVSYLKHPDGFAKENMVMDDNAEQCEVFDSLKKAQQRLDQKLSYYANEA